MVILGMIRLEIRISDKSGVECGHTRSDKIGNEDIWKKVGLWE